MLFPLNTLPGRTPTHPHTRATYRFIAAVNKQQENMHVYFASADVNPSSYHNAPSVRSLLRLNTRHRSRSSLSGIAPLIPAGLPPLISQVSLLSSLWSPSSHLSGVSLGQSRTATLKSETPTRRKCVVESLHHIIVPRYYYSFFSSVLRGVPSL